VENVSRLALFLLGPPRVERDGEPVHIPRRKAVALLAYLAMTGESHSRDTLAALLWSEQDQDGARAGLRRVLTSLRKTLGATRLDADRETVCLDQDAEFWLDVTEFQGRLAECRRHDHAPEAVCPACVSLLAEAVDLYRDDFLAGFTLRDSPAFDDWQFFQTQDLRDQLAGALERLAHWHDSQKQVGPAIPYARRWLALDPLHEPAHRCLMRLYAGSGQHAAALRQYAQCERVLREELGVSPGEETVQLCQIIKEKRELPPAVGHISTAPLAAEPSSFSNVLGALLGDRYRLDAEIGRGGVGTVYRAYDTLLERGVAVKVLSATTLSAESRTRLLREAQAAAKLNHPNVVSVYDAGKARGVPFIVMELVEGESLHERRPQTLEETLSVARQVCTALEHAHAHGIIHRDLKPENVMIAPDDTAKLMDFGLARSGTSRLTVEGAIVGTVSYLSPEQAGGGKIDHRADLYSLGVMLYELTTGQLPFTGDDVLAVISQHLHTPVVPPRTHSPTIPPELDALIVRLLSKRPEDRPSSAAEVRQALESLSGLKQPARQVEEGALDIPPPAPGPRPDTPARLPAFLGEEGREERSERPVFVARERELARLDGFLDMALAGQGRVAFVTGGAGRGKTALVQEFARRALDAHPRMLVATGGCNPYSGVGDPYLPFREILGMLTGDVEGCWAAGVIDTDHARRLWAAVPQAVQALTAHGGFLLDIFVPSRALLSRAATAAPAGAAWLPELKRLIERSESRPPDLAQHHLFDQYADVLHDLSAHHPLVLLLDDLQWVDTASSGLLYHLGRRLDGSHVLIVCAYRPDEVALGRPSAGPWSSVPGTGGSGEIERHPLEKVLAEFKRTFGDVWIDLAQVDRARGRQFIASFLETEPNRLGDEFRNRLFRHTEGHALFTVELLRAMQDRGDLVQDGDGYWIEGATLDWEALPTRVEAVIEERIERLEDELREILTVASVEGEDFTAQVVARVQEIGERKLLRALSRQLERRHRLVREQGEVRVGSHSLSRYRFAHALFQQYLYNGLSEGERRLLHKATAEVLEELYEGRTDEIAVQLARHWERAEELERATEYLLRAGDQARLAFAFEQAIDHYQRALVLLKAQGKHGQAARTLMRLGLTYHSSFDFQRARDAYDEGFALWQRAGEAQGEVLPPAPHALRECGEPFNLDPARSAWVQSIQVINQLFSGLVDLSPDMEVVPDVARSWEMLEGGRKFVFHLRDDVRWSDGVPVTAADFEYAWKRTLDPVTGFTNIGRSLYDVKGARAFQQGELSDPDQVGVRALDDVTLAVELEGPTGYFLYLLTHHWTYPVPRHVVETHGEAWTEPQNIVTNGPFRLESWQRGESLVLVRNPEYHGRFGGNLQRVEQVALRDWSAALAMYEAGDLDVVGLSGVSNVASEGTPAERDAARRRYASEYVSVPGLSTFYVGFKVDRPPFDDIRVRRAFVMAADRERMADVLRGSYASPATGGLIPPGIPGHTPGIGLPYDPEGARHLLAQAGYPGAHGFPAVNVLISHRIPETEFLQAQWRENLGIEIHCEIVDFETLEFSDLPYGQIFLLAWAADYPDPDNFLRMCPGLYIARWQNDAYYELVEKARRVMDREKRIELYREADKILMEEAAIMPTFYGRIHLLVKPWVTKYPTTAITPWFLKDVVIEPH
jgi:ABC-type oligopeptide transport system substrate-binding subunit/DNA-binding SARP family transcriptional activator/predicted Ser/Thr protein kinase